MTMIIKRYKGYNIRQTVKGSKVSKIHIDINGLRTSNAFSTVQDAVNYINGL